MRGIRIPRGVVLALIGTVVIAWVLSAPAAAAPPNIHIKVKNLGGGNCVGPGTCCRTANSCELLVKDNRGLGVCKTPRTDGATYCYASFSWEVLGNPNLLTPQHKIVIEWSRLSTRGSYACLNEEKYELTDSTWKANATVQGGCPDKSAWFYDITLWYNTTKIDSKDPGVIIDN